jgi:putative alpha-1,2-mannosidase
MKLNGELFIYPFIKHENIVKGGKLVFEMSEKP